MTPTLEARLAEVLPCYECHPVEHRTGCPAVHRPAILALIRERPEFALKIMSILADRIRRMNASL